MKFNNILSPKSVADTIEKHKRQIEDYWDEQYASMVEVLENMPGTDRPKRLSPEKLTKLHDENKLKENFAAHNAAAREAAYELGVDQSLVWNLGHVARSVTAVGEMGGIILNAPGSQVVTMECLATLGRLTVDIPIVSPATRGRYSVHEIKNVLAGNHRDFEYFSDTPNQKARLLGITDEQEDYMRTILRADKYWSSGTYLETRVPLDMDVPTFLGTLATMSIVTGGRFS